MWLAVKSANECRNSAAGSGLGFSILDAWDAGLVLELPERR